MMSTTGTRHVAAVVTIAILGLTPWHPAHGLFHPAATYAVGADPTDVACADLDGDGSADLVVVNESSNSVSVLLNNGNGTFQPAAAYGVGQAPQCVALGTLNADQHADLVVSNSLSDSISLLFNNGDGTFAAAIDYGVGTKPWDVATADLNGDGDVDVAAVNRESQTFSVMLNNGDGTLWHSGDYSAGGFQTKPIWISAANFDGDADVDLAVTKLYAFYGAREGYVETFLNDGTGSFTSSQTFTIGLTAATPVVEDLDGDDDIDIAVPGLIGGSFVAAVLTNDGSGTFSGPVSYPSGADGEAASGDFDLDDDCDLAISRTEGSATAVSVTFNDGGGAFGMPQMFVVGSDPRGLCADDLDNNGAPDVAVALWGADSVAVLLNTNGLVPPGDLGIRVDGAQITLTWTAVPGAASYKIYSSDAAYGGFMYLATTTQTTWSGTSATTKAFYYVTAASE
jgi:hypothetical protein